MYDGTVTAVLHATPPSHNTFGTGARAGRALYATISQWKNDLHTAFIVAGLPRPLSFVHYDVRMTFPQARDRDEDNHLVVLRKAVGDTLCPHLTREERKLGLKARKAWLPNDTPEFLSFGRLDFAVAPRTSRTEIVLSYRLGPDW